MEQQEVQAVGRDASRPRLALGPTANYMPLEMKARGAISARVSIFKLFTSLPSGLSRMEKA